MNISQEYYKKLSQEKLNEELLASAMNGRLEEMKFLLLSKELYYNANIHFTDENGNNALILSAKRGHIENIKFLLSSTELSEHAQIESKKK